MKDKLIPSVIIISFITIFLIFYKGLQETNIYTPKSEIKKNIPISSKPLLLLGGGCRNPFLDDLSELLEKIDIPFVTTWLGYDLIEFTSKNHLGHVGMAGHRGANLAIGNCYLNKSEQNQNLKEDYKQKFELD